MQKRTGRESLNRPRKELFFWTKLETSPCNRRQNFSVLQNRYVVKVGSNKQIPVDIRLVCATNCDLNRMVTEGRFREDLLYRINTIMIEVPPLRDRVDDIPILANYFLRINSDRYGKGIMKFSTHALENSLIMSGRVM